MSRVQDLTDSMMAYLRLSFNNEQASDERVRAAFLPALYAWDLQSCAVSVYAACLRPGPCDRP